MSEAEHHMLSFMVVAFPWYFGFCKSDPVRTAISLSPQSLCTGTWLTPSGSSGEYRYTQLSPLFVRLALPGARRDLGEAGCVRSSRASWLPPNPYRLASEKLKPARR